MNERETRRSGVLDRVKSEDLTQVEAAEILGLSYRQTKRLYRRFLKLGGEGMVHGHVGKRSNHAKEARFRRRVLALVRKHYGGDPGERFGPTLAAEHLAEDQGVVVDAETLRRWMLDEGLWTRARKRKPYRQRRMRRAHFGELVQMDGSFEDWLETRGPRGCLIHMVDDATSTSLATFTSEETTWGVAETLRAWVEKYGIPRALYVDWKTVYLVQPTERQKQEGIVPMSQFGGMCAKLGIELIGANSAQAKGRVERGHRTHQDRLIKKMRLKKIATYAKANTFLTECYLGGHNTKYAVTPREKADFHQAPAAGLDLNQVFCLEEERKVSNDWVVQYGKRWLQIEAAGQKAVVGAGSTVAVREHRDGSLTLLRGRTVLRWHELTQRPKAKEQAVKRRVVMRPKPAPEHPWRKPYLAAQGR
jgi:transposase